MTCFHQVENTVFRVHRYQFVASKDSAFAAMFSLPAVKKDPTDTPSIDGDRDAAPLHLPHVTLESFEALLHILYAPSVTSYLLMLMLMLII